MSFTIDEKAVLNNLEKEIKSFIKKIPDEKVTPKKLEELWIENTTSKIIEKREKRDVPACKYHIEGKDGKIVNCTKPCKRAGKGKFEGVCSNHFKFAYDDDFEGIRCSKDDCCGKVAKSTNEVTHEKCKRHENTASNKKAKKPKKTPAKKAPTKKGKKKEEEEEEAEVHNDEEEEEEDS